MKWKIFHTERVKAFAKQKFIGDRLSSDKIRNGLNYLSNDCVYLSITGSVTRLDDLLHFWQLFKAYCNNYFGQIVHVSSYF